MKKNLCLAAMLLVLMFVLTGCPIPIPEEHGESGVETARAEEQIQKRLIIDAGADEQHKRT